LKKILKRKIETKNPTSILAFLKRGVGKNNSILARIVSPSSCLVLNA